MELRLQGLLQGRTRQTIQDADLRQAAVLLPLFTLHGAYHVLFIKRSRTVEHHKGEISFPGGICEASDSALEGTALRETHEEIGIRPEDVRVLGLLDDIRQHRLAAAFDQQRWLRLDVENATHVPVSGLGDQYAARGRDQRLHTETLAADRGTIFDAEGRELALTVDSVTVYANPAEVTDPAVEARYLASLTGQDPDEVEAILSGEGTFAYVARQLDPADADLVREVVARVVGLPVTPHERDQRLDRLAAEMVERVGLRDEDADRVVRRLRVTMANLDLRPGRPNLVVAVPGLGRAARLAQVLAEVLFGDGARVVEEDFSSYTHPADVTRLIGAAPGYVGHDKALRLHLALRQQQPVKGPAVFFEGDRHGQQGGGAEEDGHGDHAWEQRKDTVEAAPGFDEKHACPCEREDQSPADVGRFEVIGSHVLGKDAPECDPHFHDPPPAFSFSFFIASTPPPVRPGPASLSAWTICAFGTWLR